MNFLKLSGLMGMQKGLIKDSTNSHYLVPNSEGIIFNKKVFIDKNGFRIPTKDFQYVGNKNIYIIGDSTTFGNGVMEEETFIGLMRKNFSKINFYNSAVPGYQIKHYRENLKEIKKFKNIDKIFYFFTLNDVFEISNIVKANQEVKKIEEDAFKLKNINLINYINSFLRNKSYLYMFIKGQFTDPSKRWYANINNFYQNYNISLLDKYLNELIYASDLINAELFVVLLPYEYQTRNCNSGDLLPQKKIGEAFSNFTINFKDYTNYFCNTKKPKDNFYKFDPMHLSEKGHKLVYDLIINEIKF